ncbi:MAG: outer rane lipoprotein chaperone LolA [Pseudomonadota bacterium]|jgi:outer membrane lipoprotein carrier protein|uniref:Outer-membrane lipoprotein carrier protein n=1 Tax=Thiothrix fructosivorans TaxID=111770 RepID=A0A8B0SIG1_9GAMM|nr:outer membrane lipoprotein chaperone LolA [Thiothrix fructosivorans]MBO0613675.1 outer membrane lipoprotein chaperone LolA [Thiothrix fructosivorans]QTX10911.1 outer membrane lipoprotein chaperone LolA [Thiothrix fructosivorans]
MKTTFKKTFKNTLAVWVATGLMSTSAWAGGRDKLDEFFTQINTMQSAFTQQVIDDKGALRQSSSGNVYLSRPGKFRWEYAAPDKHEIVADGKNVWVYDVELDQVTVKPMTQALSAAPVGMLTQKQSVDKQFNVQEMEADGSKLEWFRLTPKKKDSDFTTMDLGVSTTGVEEMILGDKFGQQTYIKFEGLRTDIDIDSSRFSFTPPKGADVIGKAS